MFNSVPETERLVVVNPLVTNDSRSTEASPVVMVSGGANRETEPGMEGRTVDWVCHTDDETTRYLSRCDFSYRICSGPRPIWFRR